MQEHPPGLVVIMTDCCSTRFSFGKTPAGSTWTRETLHRLIRSCGVCSTSLGLVDITAASGDASFGDDHEGGIFTRSFAKLVEDGIATSDANHDGFVSWPEFF